MYCKKCGGKLESYASNCAFCGTPVEKYDTNVNYVREEPKEPQKHMTALKWIGLSLLPGIPLIGALIYIILMFKWSSKKNEDLTLQGFARANLITLLLVLILIGALVAVVLATPGLFDEVLNEMQEI